MTLLEKDITSPDPNAPYIDWTKKRNGAVYYDARDSLYYAVLVDNFIGRGSNGTRVESPADRLYRLLGYEAIRNFLSKELDTWKASNTEMDTWLNSEIFKLAGYNYPTRQSAPNKARFAITPENYVMILEKMKKKAETETTATETTTTETTTTEPAPATIRWITIDPSELDTMFEDLNKTLDTVGRAYECAYRNGTYNVPNLRFGTRIKKVKKFQAKINEIIFQKAGMKKKHIKAIALRHSSLDNKASFDQIWTKHSFTEEWMQVKTGAKNMGKKDPFNDPATINFILNAPEIARDFLSEKPKDYKTFIEQYYVPTPNFPQADPLDPLQGASTLLGAFGSNGTGAPSCAANFAGSFLETVPGNQVSGQLTKYSDCIEKLDTATYYDPKGRKELEAILNDTRLSNRRVADALMTSVDTMDPIVDQIRINIEESKNLGELYVKVLDPLGVEGIAKLLASGAALQLKCLTLDVAVKQICLSALEMTTKVQIYELYKNVVWDSKTEGLYAPTEFTLAWDFYSSFALPIPPLDAVNPETFTAPPGSNIPAEKPQLSIGIPSLSTDPSVPMIRASFINMIEQDLVSPYSMIEEILNTPMLGGAGILGVALGINSFNFKFKIGKIAPMTMPYIPPIIIPSLGDLAKLVIEFAKQALERAATEIAKALMIKVLDTVFGFCDDPLIADNILGSSANTILNVMRGEICSPQATDDEVAETMKQLLDSFSVWEVNSTQERPNAGDVRDFAETASRSTSPQELINLLNGTASESTIQQVSESVQAMSNNRVKEALSSDSALENLFASLGTLINRNALQAQKDLGSLLNTPKSPEICADPFQIVAEDEATRAALLAKGLNEDQIAKQMTDATDRALARIGDLAKTLLSPSAAMGMESGMPIKQTPSGPVINPVSTDPTKDDGLFPMEDESTKDFNSLLFDSTYNSLDSLVMQDLMVGNPLNMFSKGFLDMILSSNNGRGYMRISGELIDADGELKYSDLQKEIPQYVSGLFTSLANPEDFLEVTNDSITAIYSGPEEPAATGSPAPPPITTIIYQMSGPIFINYNSNGLGSLEHVVNITYSPTANATDIIADVSPDSNNPKNILANWCAGSLTDHLTSDDENSTEREAFIEGTREYIANHFHKEIIQNILNTYFHQSVDIVENSNIEAWTYGNAEPKEPDLVELEDDQGSFYIRACTQDYKGWMNVYDNAIPVSTSPTREVPLFNFVDIKQESQNYYDTVPEDTRTQISILGLKKYAEPPFARINTRINNAMLAGLNSATCRLSLYDSLIKGSAFFRIYSMSEKNYGDVFLSYMVDSIIQEVLDESLKLGTFNLKPLGIQGYYYLFLEQVVQSYSNMVNTGLISPTAQAQQSLRTLNEKLQANWKLDIKSIARVPKFKEFIDSSLPDIKIILSQIISIQMEKVTEATSRVYQPRVEDLNKNILESWLEGGTKSSDFGLNPPGPLTLPTSLSDPFLKSGDLDFPFIFQRYIRLVNAAGSSTVVNIDDLDEDLVNKNVEFFVGNQISLYMPLDYINEFNTKTQSYIKSSLEAKFDSSKSFISADKDGNTRYLIPLFSKELESTATEVSTMPGTTQTDLSDLILNSGEFEALFKISVPMSGLLSFATIYTIENFVESLAIKKRDQGFQAFRFWNGDTFAMSKEYLRKMSQQAYYARSIEYINQIALDLSSPSINADAVLGIGKSAVEARLLSKLPKWKRKKRRPAPPDVCED
tara:strand:+ start:4151 stop:9298 length:5148 start_codon:yes stop_codon:yes gene_type:complete